MQPRPPPPRRCSSCGGPFEPGASLVKVGAQTLHPACLACHHCGVALSGDTGVYPSGRSLACSACYQARHSERCGACKEPIAPGSRFVRFRDEKLHPACFRCTSCSLDLSEGFHEREGKAWCRACDVEQFGEKCAVCRRPLADAEKRAFKYVTLNGRRMHPGCLSCSVCAKQLSSGGFYEKDGQPFCEEHYAEAHGRRCALCANSLLTWSQNGWGEAYCLHHEKEYPSCHGCVRGDSKPRLSTSRLPLTRLAGPTGALGGRLVVTAKKPQPQPPPILEQRSSGVDYADGRSLCASCVPSAVHAPTQAEAILADVGKFFAQHFGLDVPAVSFPVNLLDRNSLQQVCQASGSYHATLRCPLGVTCCSSLVDRGSRTEAGPRRVSEVACLSGLPEGFLSSILAHELGHIYMHLHGFPTDLAPVVSEGVCELFSYLWLERGHPGSGAERKYRIESLKRNQGGDVYSEGYRQALAAYYACGNSLQRVLQQVRTTRTLGPAIGRRPHR